MSHHPGSIMPPGPPKRPSTAVSAPPKASSKAVELMCSNKLLAGYMAYEFLTKGTLFGKKYAVPVPAEAVPVRSDGSAELKRVKREAELGGGKKEEEEEEERSYDKVARIVRSDGVHIPGIVNPAQLARWTRAS